MSTILRKLTYVVNKGGMVKKQQNLVNMFYEYPQKRKNGLTKLSSPPTWPQQPPFVALPKGNLEV